MLTDFPLWYRIVGLILFLAPIVCMILNMTKFADYEEVKEVNIDKKYLVENKGLVYNLKYK